MALSLNEYQVAGESLSLARLLILENYPLEVPSGLLTIAKALIEREGFEDRFKAVVAEAQAFIDDPDFREVEP